MSDKPKRKFQYTEAYRVALAETLERKARGWRHLAAWRCARAIDDELRAYQAERRRQRRIERRQKPG